MPPFACGTGTLRFNQFVHIVEFKEGGTGTKGVVGFRADIPCVNEGDRLVCQKGEDRAEGC